MENLIKTSKKRLKLRKSCKSVYAGNKYLDTKEKRINAKSILLALDFLRKETQRIGLYFSSSEIAKAWLTIDNEISALIKAKELLNEKKHK